MIGLSREKKTILACLLAVAVSGCAPPGQPNAPGASENRPKSNEVDNRLNFSLTNLTGATIRGFYLSPIASKGWEENLLGKVELQNGDTVNIQFSPHERASTWDMRIEGVDGHYAELKEINLGELSKLTLLLRAMPEPVVIVEAE
jgi:hypothetical protein